MFTLFSLLKARRTTDDAWAPTECEWSETLRMAEGESPDVDLPGHGEDARHPALVAALPVSNT